MTRFMLGAIVGAIAVWVWGEEIRRFANTRAARRASGPQLQSTRRGQHSGRSTGWMCVPRYPSSHARQVPALQRPLGDLRPPPTGARSPAASSHDADEAVEPPPQARDEGTEQAARSCVGAVVPPATPGRRRGGVAHARVAGS
jgi:hypothetical protein